LRPRDLIASAKLLVHSGSGKPSQVNLRRATSSAYYALFHRLARSCADLLVGGEGAAKSKHAWRQTYRALSHGETSNACRQKTMLAKFPRGIEDFGHTFLAMQDKRHAADYDPHVRLTKSEVLADIASVEQAMADFEREDAKDRRAFCAFVLFRKRS
jgi:uncharacterized protein (UPF0332 family)